jgi:DNA-binding XRE family transcriptional regulator
MEQELLLNEYRCDLKAVRKFYLNILEQHRLRRRIACRGDYKIHMDIPALPFSRFEISIKKPFGKDYPLEPKTLGDVIRRKRIEKNLLQKDVAKIIVVTEESIYNWENNHSKPQVKFYPAIKKFINEEVEQINSGSLSEQIKLYRIQKGLSAKRFGKIVKVNASTILSWELGKSFPSPLNMKKLISLNFNVA